MFEDSLVESCGRIRTRSQRYVAGCLLLELALVTAFILVPYLYPAALPARLVSVPLLAPPPAPAPAMVEQRASHAAAAHPEMLMRTLLAPPKIPTLIRKVVDDLPPSLVIGSGSETGRGNGSAGAILPNVAPAPAPRVEQQKAQRPPRISAGVAAGQLIAPIRPIYPVIARETRTQGTVVVEATISTTGQIENARAVSGPPLLVHAALAAVREARYRPFLLNETPVEVETTIQVVFTLN